MWNCGGRPTTTRWDLTRERQDCATLEDVGREIGLTRERVRQIQVEGLRRLREILQGQGLNIEALFRE
jgi:RNA polymerase nonessential primary-like sigma factor